MYAAIDLAAGEKERGTLETLLTSPADRFSIVLGKFGVVVVTGVVSAAMSIVGMYIGMRMNPDIPQELLQMVMSILEPGSIALLLSLLLPLTVLFAAMLLSISIFAKSFKEAQSFASPLMIVVFVPAFMAMLPGINLNTTTALIPILNVAVATKHIIAGNVSTPLLIEVYASLIVIALLGLWACSRFFAREATVFRGV
jgi:sodium transport system permease protein